MGGLLALGLGPFSQRQGTRSQGLPAGALRWGTQAT